CALGRFRSDHPPTPRDAKIPSDAIFLSRHMEAVVDGGQASVARQPSRAFSEFLWSGIIAVSTEPLGCGFDSRFRMPASLAGHAHEGARRHERFPYLSLLQRLDVLYSRPRRCYRPNMDRQTVDEDRKSTRLNSSHVSISY